MLELRGITVVINDENARHKTILDDVNLHVEQNSFFVITGPNGSGKSTLAKVIMGIQKPTAGSVLLDGEDITGLNVTERARRGISFAFQQPVRFKGLSVHDALSLASGSELGTEKACDFLFEVGMCAQDYLDRELNGTLSGGEMKRIEIAMLLARNTRLSVFDEPEAGIDLWSFQNLIEVFQRLKETGKGASVCISHQERILGIADTIAVLSLGKVVAVGAREEVLPTLASSPTPCGRFMPVTEGAR